LCRDPGASHPVVVVKEMWSGPWLCGEVELAIAHGRAIARGFFCTDQKNGFIGYRVRAAVACTVAA
jgi:hypothetical protein